MRRLFFFLLLISCGKANQQTVDLEKSKSLDLLKLQEAGGLTNTQEIVIINDPVYHKTKKYEAVSLIPLLHKFTFVDSLDVDRTKVVFECEDGYKPEMSLRKLVSSKSYLAVSDLDAPAGLQWEKIVKDGTEMKAAPFYVIYEEVSPEDYTYKWPYNLVKIHFESITDEVLPPAMLHQNGRNLFEQHCKVCHKLKGVGGEMGPELAEPMNITAYWKERHLINFIVNPQQYRRGVKMPNLGISKNEAEEIVAYIKEVN